ncbi:hypothetical protein RJZ90_004388 [Blastomyces dermatitidis]
MGRSFGGQLTREAPETAEEGRGDGSSAQGEQGSLRPSAPEFIPGVQVPMSTTTPTLSHSSTPIRERTRQPRPPKAKSTAHDIATRTHEDIANGIYECPICTNELGRKTRVWSCNSRTTRMGKTTRDSGVARDATCHTTFYHRRTTVGARKRWIRDLCRDYRPILVAKRAPGRGEGVHTLAILCAIQALVLRARLWAQRSFVFVGATSRLRNALTLIMRMVGAVGNHAGSCCRVSNTNVLVLVMKASAGPARKLSMRDVIAESLRRELCVVIEMKRNRAVSPTARALPKKG